MRTFLRMSLVVTLIAAGLPVPAAAGQSPASSLKGYAYTTDLKPLPNVRVQLRDLQTASMVQSTTSGVNGEYAFNILEPGVYIVELVNSEGRILGMSAPFRMDPGVTHTMSVVMVGQGAAATGGNSGLSLFGMGPTATLAVLGAAGAAGVTAVVTTRQDASPSR